MAKSCSLFLKKKTIIDVQLGAKYNFNVYLKKTVISEKSVLLYLCITLSLQTFKNSIYFNFNLILIYLFKLFVFNYCGLIFRNLPCPQKFQAMCLHILFNS